MSFSATYFLNLIVSEEEISFLLKSIEQVWLNVQSMLDHIAKH